MPLTDIENRAFHKVALNTIKEFQYKPAIYNGNSIGMWSVVGIEFKQNNVIPIFKSLNKYQINFYDNGQLYRLGYNSKNGSKHGEWIIYYESGEIKEEGNFTHNKKHGKFIDYYRNGNKEIEMNYINGIANGKWKTYNKDGNIKKIKEYKDGELLPSP